MTVAKVYSQGNTAANAPRVLVISDAAPHRNGVGAYYADLLADLEDRGVVVDRMSPEVVADEWRGGWTLPLPGDATQRMCLPNILEFKRRLKAFQPTVVVVPTPGLFGLTGAILAKRAGVKVIVGFHTWFEKIMGLYWNRVQSGVTRTYFEWVHKLLFGLADEVLANSGDMVAIAKEQGAKRVSLMGTPLAREMQTTPVKPVPKTIRRVLFVGRLAAEKNIEAVIAAAQAFPDLSFNIAGEGPERKNLESIAQGMSNVRFLGWIGREQLTDLIDQHDAVVLPSHVESFGTVAMEAMARQRFVIVSQSCGITEWPDLRAGLSIIAPDQTLADSLRQVSLLSEFEIFSHCSAARRYALRHVEWNRDHWLSCLAKDELGAAGGVGAS